MVLYLMPVHLYRRLSYIVASDASLSFWTRDSCELVSHLAGTGDITTLISPSLTTLTKALVASQVFLIDQHTSSIRLYILSSVSVSLLALTLRRASHPSVSFSVTLCTSLFILTSGTIK